MFTIGALIRLSATFTDAAGALADPGTVTFKIRAGVAGTVTTYQYGIDVALVRDGSGLYHVDYPAVSDGLISYRFAGGGANTAAAEDAFSVDVSRF